MKYENIGRANDIVCEIKETDLKITLMESRNIAISVHDYNSNKQIKYDIGFINDFKGAKMILLNSILMDLKEDKKSLLEELSKL